MRYSIVRYESNFGAMYYQVRLHRWWGRPWLKGSNGEILTFEQRKDAHRYMGRYDDSVPAADKMTDPLAEGELG